MQTGSALGVLKRIWREGTLSKTTPYLGVPSFNEQDLTSNLREGDAQKNRSSSNRYSNNSKAIMAITVIITLMIIVIIEMLMRCPVSTDEAQGGSS